MPWDVFINKVKCNECGDIIIPESDSKWTECSCGETAVMGKSFLRIKGKNYKDLSRMNFDDVPEHKAWDGDAD